MKILASTIVLLLLLSSLIFAGTITGTITKGGQPQGSQVVTIKSADEQATLATAKTDKTGHFSVYVQKLGPCKLEVSGQKFTIYSNQSPTNYNITLK